ncbi:MAG TPA: hypothetical protein VGE21_05800 [Flavobacteriales bacterium]
MRRSISSCFALAPLLLVAQAGTLDPSFSDDGLLTSDLLSFDDEVHAVAVQPDGRIIGAGWTEDGTHVIAFVQRFLDNGDPDPSFGTAGQVHSASAQELRYAYAVGVQSTGRIIVAGLVYDINLDGNAMLLGFLPDGTPDPDFGDNGFVSSPYNAEFGFQSAWAMRILPDDRIVVVGEEGESGIACARFSADGELDPGFGTNGVSVTGVPFSTGLCLEVQNDGQVIVGGYHIAGKEGSDWLLARFDEAGLLDPDFGDAGVTTIDVGGGATEFMRGMSLLEDGRISVCGHRSFSGSDDQPIVGLFESNGAPDMDFGTGGIEFLPYFTPQWGQARAILAQPDGKLLVSGFRVQTGGPANNDFFLMRLLDDGSLDASFADEGLVHTDVSGSYDRAFDMAMDQEDRIIVAGYGTGTARVASYARYLNDIGTSLPEGTTEILHVFPQPATEQINIHLDGTWAGPFTASLLALDGSLVRREGWSATGINRMHLPADLVQGVYVLEIRASDRVLRSKVMVMRR